VLLLVTALLSLGCASAYDQTYQRELDRLEGKHKAQEVEDRAAHSEASRYAAVVYLDLGSSAVKPDGYQELDWFIQQMQPFPKAIIEVNGFADATGGDTVGQVSLPNAPRTSRTIWFPEGSKNLKSNLWATPLSSLPEATSPGRAGKAIVVLK
jgi:hypothetical protein